MDNENNEKFIPEDKEYEAAKKLFETETYQKQLNAVVSGILTKKPKAVGRVLRKLVLEPIDGINDNNVQLFGKEENDLYNFCKEIMYAKSVVIKNQLNKLLKEKGETNE